MGNTMTQGMSAVTPVKEIQIHGVVQMRIMQRKRGFAEGWVPELRVYDVFAGDGENIVQGETIQGSPLEIADAVIESGLPCSMHASDINEMSTLALARRLSEKPGLKHTVTQKPAAQALADVAVYLSANKKNIAVVVVDPNGPGVLPYRELLNLATHFPYRCDLLLNISETAMKRILACAVTKDKNWWAPLSSFPEFIWSLGKHYRQMWVRRVLPSDPQRWRMLCFWSGVPPKDPWAKQQLYIVDSLEALNKELS